MLLSELDKEYAKHDVESVKCETCEKAREIVRSGVTGTRIQQLRELYENNGN